MSFERLRKLPLIPPHCHGKLSRKPEGGVEFEAADRVGHERLLRYCARPPFALERLRELDCEHFIYDHPKPGPGGSGPLPLTPLELPNRLAPLVPSPLHPPRPPLRCAGANDRSREILAATLTVWRPIAALRRGSESRWGSLARGRLAKTLTGIFDHLLLRRGRWNAHPGRG